MWRAQYWLSIYRILERRYVGAESLCQTASTQCIDYNTIKIGIILLINYLNACCININFIWSYYMTHRRCIGDCVSWWASRFWRLSTAYWSADISALSHHNNQAASTQCVSRCLVNAFICRNMNLIINKFYTDTIILLLWFNNIIRGTMSGFPIFLGHKIWP